MVSSVEPCTRTKLITPPPKNINIHKPHPRWIFPFGQVVILPTLQEPLHGLVVKLIGTQRISATQDIIMLLSMKLISHVMIHQAIPRRMVLLLMCILRPVNFWPKTLLLPIMRSRWTVMRDLAWTHIRELPHLPPKRVLPQLQPLPPKRHPITAVQLRRVVRLVPPLHHHHLLLLLLLLPLLLLRTEIRSYPPYPLLSLPKLKQHLL